MPELEACFIQGIFHQCKKLQVTFHWFIAVHQADGHIIGIGIGVGLQDFTIGDKGHIRVDLFLKQVQMLPVSPRQVISNRQHRSTRVLLNANKVHHILLFN